MKSHQARLYIEGKAKSTSGVNNINSEEISGLPVPLFSNTEQQLIIEAIESRVSVCEDIENTVKKALQQTLSMRQSVLKMAFEGRL